MEVRKTVLGEIDKCYATCLLKTKDGLLSIGCSEGASSAYAFFGEKKTVVWDEIGGTMNFVQIPGRENEFLATRRFTPVFQAADCDLNYVCFSNNEWTVTPVMKFPYLHRFDCFEKNGELYFIGATLCETKAFQQDWSTRGSVYVGKLHKNLSDGFSVKKIYSGITKNHGLWHERDFNGKECFIVSGVQGAFALFVPSDPLSDDWEVSRLIDEEVSDVAVCDINGDGRPEIAAILPFHGNKCRIYKTDADGKYTMDFEYDIDFGHVLWGGCIAGTKGFLLGYRRKDMRIYFISYRNNVYFMDMIDENVGPSQVSVVNDGDTTYALFANRQINQLALYELSRHA